MCRNVQYLVILLANGGCNANHYLVWYLGVIASETYGIFIAI